MKLLILMVALLALSACSTQLADYKGSQPEIKLESFFNGNLKAYGLVMDWQGKVIRRFSVDMKASWEKNIGILEEEFYYKDGERQQRIWKLTRNITEFLFDIKESSLWNKLVIHRLTFLGCYFRNGSIQYNQIWMIDVFL